MSPMDNEATSADAQATPTSPNGHARATAVSTDTLAAAKAHTMGNGTNTTEKRLLEALYYP